jgi:hypothetical protein
MISLRRNPGHLHALIGYAHLSEVKGLMHEAEELYSRALDFHEGRCVYEALSY